MSFLPKWFRFHLSTAIVLMLASSVLLALNLTKQNWWGYGWPMTCFTLIHFKDEHFSVSHWHIKELIIDVVTFYGLLTILAMILEKRIAVKKRVRPDGSLSDEENNDS